MKKKTNHLQLITSAALFVMILVAGYRIASILRDYAKSVSLYDEAKETYVVKNNVSEGARESENTDDEGDLPDAVWNDMISVDMKALQKENEDIIGWLYFENVDISYPILYSGDNATYLRTSYNHEAVTAGSIFEEGCNMPDFSDRHTIIYGHNMRNLSMFGRLRYYRQDAEYYKEHQYFQIITEDSSYRYKIIAFQEVDENSKIYTINFSSDEDFEAFIDKQIMPGMPEEVNDKITTEDKIITLSTCSSKGKRFTVSALQVAYYRKDT